MSNANNTPMELAPLPPPVQESGESVAARVAMQRTDEWAKLAGVRTPEEIEAMGVVKESLTTERESK